MKRILLIGDSIRQGYERYVRLAFEGKAEIYAPDVNCRFSTYVLRHILDWKNDVKNCDTIDLVHWNAGLWDCLVMPDGKELITLETYKENIDRICVLIKMFFPNARVIFATSTSVNEAGYTGTFRRFNATIEKYNQAAVEVVARHGFTVNDLYTHSKALPEGCHSDMTHFNNRLGAEGISSKVIETVSNALDITPNTVDYDALFAPKENVIGI